MDSNFDIEKLDRQMPYKTPEGFFEKSYNDIMAATVNSSEKNKTNRHRLVKICAAMASAAAVAMAFFAVQREMPADNALANDEYISAHIDTMVDDLSDEEIYNWVECTDPDMYLASY